jgi:hypothetical protein
MCANPTAKDGGSSAGCGADDVYILLHGPWFLCFPTVDPMTQDPVNMKPVLLAVTADVSDHAYRIGSTKTMCDIEKQNSTQKNFPPDFFQGLTGGKELPEFPVELLRVSLQQNDLGNFNPMAAKATFILPVPREICSLRLGPAADFTTVTNETRLRNSIAKNLKECWGRVTALRYNGTFPSPFEKLAICHLYAELLKSPASTKKGVDHLNMAMRSSGSLFSNSTNFELKANSMPVRVTCPGELTRPCFVFSAEDQMTLFELTETPRCVDPRNQKHGPAANTEFANCANFGQFAVVD